METKPKLSKRFASEAEYEEFKISLKAARVNAGYSQESASKESGIARSTLAKWEEGRTEPRASDFQKLCAIYKVPMEKVKV